MEKEILKQLFNTKIEDTELRPELIEKLKEHAYISNVGDLVYFEAHSDLSNKEYLTSSDVQEIKEMLVNFGFSTFEDSAKALSLVKSVENYKELKERLLQYDCEAAQNYPVVVMEDGMAKEIKDMRLNFGTGYFEIVI